MAIVRQLPVEPPTVSLPDAGTVAPWPKPEAAKGDDDLMSTECVIPGERGRSGTEVIDDIPDEPPVPLFAHQDLAAVLARVSEHYPYLTYLTAD
ncbi:MAG: hypothetical protein IPK97_05055 [Ahniella sp.]|nr:hypothetical protein [Ahniella sp.]